MRGFLIATLILGLALGKTAQAEESGDLIWPRIAAGMRIVDVSQPETLAWAHHYTKQSNRLTHMLSGSEPFLWYIVEAVELREMPLEIALLPAIESGFNPKANSQQQARGLWQFIPGTGKVFGLQETANYDARRDAVASTRAALTYLLQLHDRFGNWLLALAAYNVGENALSRAIQKSGSYSFWDLDLPKETREHVPRLLGLAAVIKDPERFNAKLPPILNQHAAEMIALESPHDLSMATLQAGVSPEVMQRYNPGLKNLNNTQGKQWLLLPPADALALRAELADHDYLARQKTIPAVVTTRKGAEKIWVVRSGDTLWTIAKRSKVSVEELRKWNRLKPDKTLKPGHRLVIRTS